MFIHEIKKAQAEICNAIYDYAKELEDCHSMSDKIVEAAYDKWHMMNETCAELFAMDIADWIEYCCYIECPF